MTLAAVKDPMFHRYFLPMCPTYAFIDRANGKFNRSMDFKKDYAALLSAAWEIDNAYDGYLTHPEEESYQLIKSLGLDDTDSDSNETRKELIQKLVETDINNPFRKRFVGYLQTEDLP